MRTAAYGRAERGIAAGMTSPQLEHTAGQRIREHRKGNGLSQQRLAEAMADQGFGWQQGTVARAEAAKRPIRVNELAALAGIFGVDPTAFISNDRQPDLSVADGWDQVKAESADLARRVAANLTQSNRHPLDQRSLPHQRAAEDGDDRSVILRLVIGCDAFEVQPEVKVFGGGDGDQVVEIRFHRDSSSVGPGVAASGNRPIVEDAGDSPSGDDSSRRAVAEHRRSA